jgi:hypothetical protein
VGGVGYVRVLVRSEGLDYVADEVTPCEHDWKRVPPVVVAINETEARTYGRRVKGTETYNAVCLRCGQRAWLHWPEQKYRGIEYVR